MNSVGVVVLNYKGMDDTVSCINSLMKQSYAHFTVICVENGSNDGSAKKFKELKKKYGDKLIVCYNEENLGFAGGVNTGISWALDHNYEYVALINNDALADKNWLKNLIDTAQKQKSGITTGLLLRENGKTIDSSGEQYSKWGLGFPRNRGDKAGEAPKGGFVFGATGGATLYSLDMIREIGLFDEDFFAYYEDVDISFRAQLAGHKVYYEPTAIAYHKLMQTSKRMRSGFATYQTFKNLPLVFIKNVPSGLLLPIGVRFYFAYLMMLGRAIVRREALPALHGVLRAFLLGFKKLPMRWHILRSKRVSTGYIKNLLWDDLPPDQTGLRKLRKVFTGK